MQTTTGFLGMVGRKVAVGMWMVVVALGMVSVVPSVLAAATVGGDARFDIAHEERRLHLALSLEAGQGVVGGRVDTAMVLYRFRIVATDRSGAAIAAADSLGAWEATVMVTDAARGARASRPLVQLSSRSNDFTLPRPLGFRLEAGDSIELRVVTPQTSLGAELHLEVEYEVGSQVASRLVVTPLPARGAQQSGEAQTSESAAPGLEWNWTPENAGRLLAIAGLALEMVRDAVLEDAETGERLWSATLRGADGQSVFGNGGDVVRMGVAVQAGRTYRLRATLCASSVAAHAQGELLALVLPAGAR